MCDLFYFCLVLIDAVKDDAKKRGYCHDGTLYVRFANLVAA